MFGENADLRSAAPISSATEWNRFLNISSRVGSNLLPIALPQNYAELVGRALGCCINAPRHNLGLAAEVPAIIAQRETLCWTPALIYLSESKPNSRSRQRELSIAVAQRSLRCTPKLSPARRYDSPAAASRVHKLACRDAARQNR